MSLINTRMQNMRAQGNLDKWETRPSRYGVLDLFLQQTMSPTGLITPDLEAKAAASIGNTLQVPVIDYDGGISIGNTRSVTIADSENTSQLLTIVFATYAWGFTIVPAMYSNNEISIQRDFETKFNKYLYKFAETLDAAGKAQLEANKSKIYAEMLNYVLESNTLTATWAQRNEIIGDLDSIMNANDFYGQKYVVGNAGLESIIRRLSELGLYNAENKQIQYADKILHWSNRIANAGAVAAVKTITFSGVLVTDNKVTLNADGTAVDVTFATDHATTMTAIAAAIAADVNVATATVDGNTIEITAAEAGVDIEINNVNVTLGATQVTATVTTDTANVVPDYAAGFIVPEGAVGILTRFERDAILGTKSRTGHEWGIESLPMVDMPVGTYYYESVADYNAIGGAGTADLTRTLKQHYGFAVDVAFVVAYNSDTDTYAGAISKFAIKTSV